jgi:hypothetical protein
LIGKGAAIYLSLDKDEPVGVVGIAVVLLLFEAQ